jgi:hypothetical protein
MATTMEPESTHRSGPAALHCDCSQGTPKSHGVMGDESSPAKLSSPGALQIQLEEKYLLERVPSPVRIKPVKSNEPTSPELSPPPSPKRKREVEFSKDLKDVAFSGVLPSKNVDLARSQSTF